jgi:hypothetical protein
MTRHQNNPDNRHPGSGVRLMMIKRAFAIAILASVLPGCAHNAEWMHRQPAVESTIGSDLHEAPAGTVSGPRGMGVDLTGASPKALDSLKA